MPLIEQVLHRNNVADPIGGIDVVHNSDVPHIQPDKIFFQKLAHHKAVAAQPGMIFHHKICYKALFSQFHDLHKSRTGKRNT